MTVTATPPRADGGSRTGRSRTGAAWWHPLLAISVAGALWWLVTSVLAAPDSLLREFAPQRVFPALIELAHRGVLIPDAAASLWRLTVGLLIAAVIGIPAGLLLGLSTTTANAVRPVTQFLRMISPLSWAPIAVALFGIGHRPVYFLIAAAAVWPIILSTTAGVAAIDPGQREVARSMGATRREQLTAVIIPAVGGDILTGLRITLGTAWIVLVPAEMLGVQSGLGYQILNARDQLSYDQVMALILVIGLLGYLLDVAAGRLLSYRRRA